MSDPIFGDLLERKILRFRPPTVKQVQDWLTETVGKLDIELCQYLNIKNYNGYVYTGKLTVYQRADIYHELNEV